MGLALLGIFYIVTIQCHLVRQLQVEKCNEWEIVMRLWKKSVLVKTWLSSIKNITNQCYGYNPILHQIIICKWFNPEVISHFLISKYNYIIRQLTWVHWCCTKFNHNKNFRVFTRLYLNKYIYKGYLAQINHYWRHENKEFKHMLLV